MTSCYYDIHRECGEGDCCLPLPDDSNPNSYPPQQPRWQRESEETTMTDADTPPDATTFPPIIERTMCDCEWFVEGVLSVRCGRCTEQARIADRLMRTAAEVRDGDAGLSAAEWLEAEAAAIRGDNND